MATFLSRDAVVNNHLTISPTATTESLMENTSSKLRERISPGDFGAVGDGVHDDTPIFNMLFSRPGEVHLTPGAVYNVSQITLTARVTLVGHGATIKAASNTNYIIRASGVGAGGFDISDVVFDCTGITCAGSPEGASAAIFFPPGTSYGQLEIRKCKFINIPTGDGQRYSAMQINGSNARIEGNFVDGCGGDIINCNTGVYNVSDNILVNGGGGAVVMTNNASGSIINNEIYKCSLGVGAGPEEIDSQTVFTNNIIVSANTFKACKNGINFGYFAYAGRTGPYTWAITRNTFIDCKTTGISYNGQSTSWVCNGTIIDNSFYRTGSNAYDGTVETNAQDIQLDKCRGVVVTGNHMYNPRATGNRYGIYMTYCIESVVSDNYMTSGTGSLGYVVGIWMCDCFTSKINGNFINYANTGIRSGQTIDGVARLQIIRNNVLRNITVLGIDVTDAGDSMTISDNIISCSAPVTCVSTSPEFSQCTIKNNVLYTQAPVAIS
ncbi:hypothetical protein BST79_gp188 [Only Syngen Nebraska virus 5]|uniref:hypothetical protein n=1 Tax=Only Syngen Nebraska virus 5 TaxID=1917232 RepID=UPI000901667D|nr:hypothetical protein BST79_gp188 [Only Syngen Nebraska virus 5]APC25701.1 hypothetical protein [Only Syngen Nebraska virus 5]